MIRKLLLLLSFPLALLGQSPFVANLAKEVEAGVYSATSGRNPFWIRSNQYGIIPLESQGVFLRARLTPSRTPAASLPNEGGEMDSLVKKKKRSVSFDYALETVINAGQTNRLLIPEAYAAVQWKALELYAGRRREIQGLVDSTLSAGSYIWSGNALPLTKVQLSIPNYTPILGEGLIAIKGNYAHGWFDDGYVENFYLHQKSLYGRVGKPHWKAKFYGGFNHQVQWGGKPAVPFVDGNTGDLITAFPAGWGTYLAVVTGQSLNRDGTGGELNGVPFNEAFNRAGNHLGTIDVGAEFILNSGKLLLYRQSVYEDGSLFYLSNISDGLLGVSYNTRWTGYGIKQLVFEHLKTTNQGGRVGSRSTIPELRGQDNYFNNSLYGNAWTYAGNVIGTPFLTPVSDVKQRNLPRPLPSSIIQSSIINNRVNAFSLSLASHHKLFDGVSRISVARNLGTYARPFDFTTFSLYQEARFPWRDAYRITASLGLDTGKLYGTQLGTLVRATRVF